MNVRGLGLDGAVGLIAALIATQVTSRAGRMLWRSTPANENAREPACREDTSSKAAARILLERTGCEPNERRLQILQKSLHYGVGDCHLPLPGSVAASRCH